MSNDPNPNPHETPSGSGSGSLGAGHTEAFRTALAKSRLAGLAFLFELLCLFGLVIYLDGRVRLAIPVREPAAIQTTRIALFAVAALSAVATRVIHGRMTARAAEDGGEAARIAVLGRAALIALSLSMIPATTGFVLYLLAGQTRDFYVLAFVSLILLFLYFPRPAAWESLLAREPQSCRLSGRT
jgi:hypothetical protein